MSDLNYLSGNKVAEAIDRRITNIAKDVFNKSPSNRMVFGRVTEINGKEYTVKVNNQIYAKVYAYKGVGTIIVGDTVDCLIPNNQYSNMRIIGILDI
jgi:hypothetical protein